MTGEKPFTRNQAMPSKCCFIFDAHLREKGEGPMGSGTRIDVFSSLPFNIIWTSNASFIINSPSRTSDVIHGEQSFENVN